MNDTAAESVGLGNMQCAREKYWSEKSADERIRTLAESLAAAMVTIKQLSARIHKLENHSHDGREMLVPYSRQDHDELLPRGYQDRIYEKLGLRDSR